MGRVSPNYMYRVEGEKQTLQGKHTHFLSLWIFHILEYKKLIYTFQVYLGFRFLLCFTHSFLLQLSYNFTVFSFTETLQGQLNHHSSI